MKIEVSESELELVVTAVDQYYSYTVAVQRTDERYKMLRDSLQGQGQKHFEKPVRKSPIISAGYVQGRNITNGIASGRFTPK